MGSGPKYSLSSRHKTKDYVAAPGPNYMPPKLGEDAPGSAFHIKGKDLGEKIMPELEGNVTPEPRLRTPTNAPSYAQKLTHIHTQNARCCLQAQRTQRY